MKDYIIIGAGLSGLHTAKKIKDLGLGSVLVLEKSRGVGGRMATRRTLGTRFDHGAQFYRLKADIKKQHQLWRDDQKSHQWFISIHGEHWCASEGMTALAKNIGLGLDIQLEKLIHTIRYEENTWFLTSDKGEEWTCRHLIVSAPLPQCIQLLERSKLHSDVLSFDMSALECIDYTKAVIALVTLEQDFKINDFGYEEFSSGEFFSISDQKCKEVSEVPALTVTMSPSFSETHFEKTDEFILLEILRAFKKKYPDAIVKGSELKKWRYCQPVKSYKELYLEAGPKLYFIGDSFGGASLLGAIRSSEKLCEVLIEEHSH
jgi:renalase